MIKKIDVDYDSSSLYLRTCSSINAKDKATEALDRWINGRDQASHFCIDKPSHHDHVNGSTSAHASQVSYEFGPHVA